MSIKGGRCNEHQPKPWATSDKKTPAERGYGAAWRKIRKQALERDRYLCQECLKHGIATLATDVDHVLSKAKGGSDDIGNLQCLCKSCHKAKTIREKQ